MLGIGASSDRIVEGWNGIPFERPLSKVAETVDFLRPALAGERTPTGFKLETAAAAGADRPRGAARQDAAARGREGRRRVHQLPAARRGCEQVVAQLDGAPEGFELLCRFFCLPGEREQVEPLARFMFASYVTVPVYAAFFRWLGHGEAIAEMCEAWAAKDRERAIAAAPWELIEEMFILGTPEQMRERLDRVRRRRDHAARC